MEKEIIHESVLLPEILELLKPVKAGTVFVDGTLGEGGHSEGFLKSFKDLTVLGIERDAEILEIARERLSEFQQRIRFFNIRFTDFFKEYNSLHPEPPGRILLDLGISKYHYIKSDRGFSFQKEESLDMRLDDGQTLSAADIVNRYSERDLADMFREFGEERFSGRISRRIVEERKIAPFETAKRLADVIAGIVPRPKKRPKSGKIIHPATKCFQALRIVVNREIENLKEVLEDSFNVLEPGGRIAVISYHSLEDRIVKRFFKEKSKVCKCPSEWPICKCGGKKELLLITKKPLLPSADEIDRNHAARSAKLRVIEKL